jgi:iron complex transport system substrate-binding protein
LGRLAGHEREGEDAAGVFSARLAALRARYAARPPVRVFYQIWGSPPITVNGRHIVSDVIRLCGGENVFAALPALAPTVGEEAVLAADPEAIVASGMDAARPPWLDDWRRWPRMRAVRADNLFFVNPDVIARPAPRILDGAQALCDALEVARQRRQD